MTCGIPEHLIKRYYFVSIIVIVLCFAGFVDQIQSAAISRSILRDGKKF